jgi:prepilin peptidase CpaA
LAIAVGFDLRFYKIPNLLIVIGISIGIAYSCYMNGWTGVLDSLIGIGIPIILLMALHIFRMLGAGDIKLFAVIGGIIGCSVWNVILYSFIVGGLLSTIHMLYHHSLVSRIHFFRNYVQSCLQAGKIIPYKSGFDEGNTNYTIHFSIAVFIGYMLWLVGKWVAK